MYSFPTAKTPFILNSAISMLDEDMAEIKPNFQEHSNWTTFRVGVNKGRPWPGKLSI